MIRPYLVKLNSKPNLTITNNDETIHAIRDGEALSKTGAISQVYATSIDGTTYFYYLIGENLYRASILINQYQVVLNAGDTVKFSYYANNKDGYYEIVNIETIK